MSDQNTPASVSVNSDGSTSVTQPVDNADGLIARYGNATSAIQTRKTVDLSAQDIAAIGASKAEQRIRTLMAAATRQLEKARKDAKPILEEMGLVERTWCQTQLSFEAEALRGAIAAFGGPVNREIDYGNATYNPDDNTFKATCSVPTSTNGSVSKTIREIAPAHYTNLYNTAREQSNTIEDLQREVSRFRIGLTQIGALERQARATLAEKILAQSEDGKAILEGFNDGTFDVDKAVDDLCV